MAKRKEKEISPDDISEIDWTEVDPVEPTPETVPEKPAAPVKKPKRDPNAVALRVFLTASGIKLDQTAGFQRYAKMHKLGPMTMKAWHEAFVAFRNRPVS